MTSAVPLLALSSPRYCLSVPFLGVKEVIAPIPLRSTPPTLPNIVTATDLYEVLGWDCELTLGGERVTLGLGQSFVDQRSVMRRIEAGYGKQ